MKILYLLDSSFPTSKAYGVTTEKTLKSLNNQGHEVQLMCHRPHSKFTFDSAPYAKTKYFRVSMGNRFFRKIAFSSFDWHSRLSWKISRQFTIIENFDQFMHIDADLIWVREKPIPWLQKMKPKSIFVIEIHEIPTEHTLKLIKKLNPASFVLCPISKILESDLRRRLPNSRIILSPMGIDEGDFSPSDLKHELEVKYARGLRKFRIGYFGKLAPNGISKGFEELLDLSSKLSRNLVSNQLVFVGVDNKDSELLESECRSRGIEYSNLEIQSYVPHTESLEIMKSCDVLVLPTTKDPRYSGHPLKAYEYANSARIILCADTVVNSQIFSEVFQPYFYRAGDLESMYSVFWNALTDSNLNEKLINGVQFAGTFTWEKRTSNILQMCEGLSS